jgi:hypothetical protein
MFTGALASGALVGYESTKRQAQMAAAAASAHSREGTMLLVAFIAGALAIGLVLFVLASAVLLKASNKRGSSSRQPAQGRQRSYGGSR